MHAIVIGSTGLVGKAIVERLLVDNKWTKVTSYSRRPLNINNKKLTEKIISFEELDKVEPFSGDVLFSALGTTLKVAGSKEAQYKIDHDYQLAFAKIAQANGVSAIVLISSVNADAHSSFFYLRMKGELEEHLKSVNFKSLNFLRPGPLKGERQNPRISEAISSKILETVPKFIVPLTARPISSELVASRAIQIGSDFQEGVHIFGPKELFKD